MRTVCRRCERTVPAAVAGDSLCAICRAEHNGDVDLAFAEVAWQEGFRHGRAQTLEGTLAAIPFRELLSLCHPDRHPPERLDLANAVTAWLNGLRDTIGATT